MYLVLKRFVTARLYSSPTDGSRPIRKSNSVRDGTVAGYAVFEPAAEDAELLLHPSDTRTGLRYSLLPMTRSIIAGPGLQRWDFSLFKNFHLTEAIRFQLRGEAFNVFNHPNPDSPSTTLGSSTYGQITAFHDPRIIQLGAKFYF